MEEDLKLIWKMTLLKNFVISTAKTPRLLLEYYLDTVDDNRMSGIISARASTSDVHVDGKKVDQLSLSLVSPLGYQHHRHLIVRRFPIHFLFSL